MAIEVTCACTKRVRVPDNAAGKKFRCPHCQAIGDIPASPAAHSISSEPSEVVPLEDTAAGGNGWRMKTPDGQIYGPVPKSELDSWVDEGRVIAECQLLRPASSVWEWAASIYPRLAAVAPGGAMVQPVMMPAANPYTAVANPYIDRPYQGVPGAPYYGPGPYGPTWNGELPISEKSRSTAGLFAIFLGPLGIHNFYMGRNAVGLIQILLTCFFCGGLGFLVTLPWAWIEALLIFAGGINTDGNGRPLRA